MQKIPIIKIGAIGVIFTLLTVVSSINTLMLDPCGEQSEFQSEQTDIKWIVERRSEDTYYAWAEEKNSPRSADVMVRPTMGTVNILVMPVYFSDQNYSTSPAEITSLWNSSTASVRHYYIENSLNQLFTKTTVLAWIEAPQPITYYADENNEDRELELAEWACLYWDSVIDYHNFNYLYFVYSGDDVSEGNSGFWPHVWWFTGEYFPAGDNIYYDRLGFVGEYSYLGSCVHEFGHSLGLWDYYPYVEGEENCGYWELMDKGGWNGHGHYPAHMGAYSKIELGWIKSNQILEITDTSVHLIKLFHLEETGCPLGYYYAVKIPYDSTFYYLVEFRDTVGYDMYLPDSGVLWSRIDLTKDSGEGRVYYLGGNHTAGNEDLTGVELDESYTDLSQQFLRWLIGDFELSIDVIKRHPSYVDVLVNRYTDLGNAWSVYNDLNPGNFLPWTFEDLQVGNYIISNWITTRFSTDADFLIQYNGTGTWVTLFRLDHILQDGHIYKVTRAGDYRVCVKNNNAANAIDVYYKIYLTTALIYDTLKYINHPNDIEYDYGTTNNRIDWRIKDPDYDNGTYQILVNGSLDSTGTWTAEHSISINIDSLGVGTYLITIIAKDGWGNEIQDQINVTVNDVGVPTIITWPLLVINILKYFSITTSLVIAILFGMTLYKWRKDQQQPKQE